MNSPHANRTRQGGAVAIITALSMAVLVGFAGLAIDGGHLYITKTELQNAADACALAASYELTGSPIETESFDRARDAGRTVGTQNRVDFQGGAIDAGAIDVAFSESLSGPWSAAGTGTSKYVRCTIPETGIMPWFMQVLDPTARTVSAFATATLSPAQTNCAIPMALCTGGGPPHYGYVKGEWVSMNFKESGGGTSDNLTGNFRWIDFDPSATTPGCSGGGAQELACLLEGTGECSLPSEGPASCAGSTSGNTLPGCVGQTGNVSSLQKAFNTRFGICQGSGCSNGELTQSPPDFTGFAYNGATWPLGRDAYGGASAGAPNFIDARNSNLPQYRQVQQSEVPSGAKRASADQMMTYGADRRLVTVPIVDCDSFAGSQHAPVRGYACILLLEPYKKAGSDVVVTAEYLGRSNEAGSPCASSGLVGNTTSIGPKVPNLVQ